MSTDGRRLLVKKMAVPEVVTHERQYSDPGNGDAPACRLSVSKGAADRKRGFSYGL